jgi:hypothetical protein
MTVGRPRSRDFLDTLMERGVVSKKSVLLGRATLTRGPGPAGLRYPRSAYFLVLSRYIVKELWSLSDPEDRSLLSVSIYSSAAGR